MKKNIKSKKIFDEIIGLDNDYRNLIKNDINIYGVKHNITKSIEFSSATANHASLYSYRNVYDYFLKNQKELSKKSFFHSLQLKIKKELNTIFFNTVKHIYLSPSGTDSEYLPLLGDEKNIYNIIIGIDEIGTSIRNTSRGKIFSNVAPFGKFKYTNVYLNEFKSKNIKTDFLPIAINESDINFNKKLSSKIEFLLNKNFKQYEKLILHLVYVSKSHKIFPSIESINRMKKKFSNLKIVVDACQMRCDFETLTSFIENNYDVIITGSKFFSAPPFCSAYLTNKRIKVLKKNSDLKKIFNDVELIKSPKITYGLLFRWKFAINEIKSFNKIPKKSQIKIIKNLQKIIRGLIKRYKTLELCEKHKFNNSKGLRIEDNLTIFLFYLKRSDKYLSLLESRKIYKHIKDYNNEVQLLSQPMKIKINNKNVGNLRVSISSSHIVSIFKNKYDYKHFQSELIKLLDFIDNKINL